MALRVLTGSGEGIDSNGLQFHDTASILVVNNRIYNMYDILNNIANGLDQFMHVTDTPGFSGYRSYIISQIRNDAEKYHTPEEYQKRSSDTINLINKLYAKKVSMSLNFNYYVTI